MLQRLKDLIQSIRDAYAGPAVALGAAADSAGNGAARAAAGSADAAMRANASRWALSAAGRTRPGSD